MFNWLKRLFEKKKEEFKYIITIWYDHETNVELIIDSWYTHNGFLVVDTGVELRAISLYLISEFVVKDYVPADREGGEVAIKSDDQATSHDDSTITVNKPLEKKKELKQ